MTTDMDLEYAYLTESQVTTLEIAEIPGMTFEKVQAVRDVPLFFGKGVMN